MNAEPMRKAYTDWIADLNSQAVTRRKERLDALQSKADAAEWSEELLAWYRERTGPLVPLENDMRIEECGSRQMDGYSIEKWRFETLPGTMTAALLYLPDTIIENGPIVCAPIGHWPTGKEEPDYQKMGGYMAFNGIPVLVYEHAGLGERREYLDPVTRLHTLGNSPTDEHNHIGVLQTLLNDMPTRTYITEAVRAREFLASFEWADYERIGYTGSSGGGSLSRLTAAYSGDAYFSIPVCIMGGESIGGRSDAEQATWSCAVRGVAGVDILAALAPMPVQFVRETGFDQVAQSYATLRRIYDLADAPAEATHLLPIDDIHGYTAPMTMSVYHFLAKNFKLEPADPDTWAHVRMLKEEDTWTGPTGVLMNDLNQVTMHEQMLQAIPEPAGLTADNLIDCLAIRDIDRAPIPYFFEGDCAHDINVCGVSEKIDNRLELIDWEEFSCDYYHRRGIVGKSNMAGAARELLCYDLSLMGIWVQQILDFCRHSEGQHFTIRGDRQWAIPVICAAALIGDTEIHFEGRYVLESYKACFEDRLSVVPIQQAIPGILKYGDIDDIISLAGDKLKIKYRTDAQGRVIKD